ncbi:MAG: hypothetical protein K2X47_16940 [Bdellovibrionales bacterium]|nr:hypothetical protein [Bdellovibrionales bacterium]
MAGLRFFNSLPLLCQRFWTSPTLLVFLFVLVIPSAFTFENHERSISGVHGQWISPLGHLQCPEEVNEEVSSESEQKFVSDTSLGIHQNGKAADLATNPIPPKNFIKGLLLLLSRSNYFSTPLLALQDGRAPPQPR